VSAKGVVHVAKVSLVRDGAQFRTIDGERSDDCLETVFENGSIVRRFTLDEVRANARKALL
jgi:hypothetical protein